MRAALCTRYGPPEVIRIEDVAKPVPGDGEVLVRVVAASVNPLDRHLVRAPLPARVMTGLRRPRDPRVGVDLAGRVEAVGAGVVRFKPGDEVFGAFRGAFAEVACGPESRLALKPASVTFEQAASAPVAGITALQGLRDAARLQPGQRVLINGAAGGVGTFAVQIARALGAEVTGVCSTGNLGLVRSLGAAHVVDYTREDFTRNGMRFDVIFDLVGNYSLAAYRRALEPGGTLIAAGILGTGMLRFLLLAVTGPVATRLLRRRFRMFTARLDGNDLARVGELMAAGQVTPVIDRRFRLSETAGAIRYIEGKHARGKVAIALE